jgi:hypothetical protein
MLTESQRQDFFNKLKEIAKVYSNRAELLEDGLEKNVLSELATEINWLCKEFPRFEKGEYIVPEEDQHEALQGRNYTNKRELIAKIIFFTNVHNLIKAHESKYLSSFLHGVGMFYTTDNDIIDFQSDFLAEIFYVNTVSAYFSLDGLRGGGKGDDFKQIINDSLTFEPLGIAYLTPELKKILQDTAKNSTKSGDVKDWGKLFDFQTDYNCVLTTCKQIEIALNYAYDEKVREFIQKEINGIDARIRGINETSLKFQKTLEDQSISQELRTHLKHTVKRCEEVIEKTRDYQKVAISEISRLFQGNTIKQHDAQAIAFLTFKKLKKDGKLNGIENIDITEIERSFTGENIDKQFIKDIFSKVQKRAADEKTDSTVEKVILTIEEFLLTLWYAIKLYLFRSKDEAKDIKKTSDWSSFVAESRSSDVIFVNRDL